MAGMAMPAMRDIPTGAPISVPSCQRIFFLRLHGFLPQNVQPEGLQRKHAEVNGNITNAAIVTRGLTKSKSLLFQQEWLIVWRGYRKWIYHMRGSKRQGQITRALGPLLFVKVRFQPWNLFLFCWTLSSLTYQHWFRFLDWYTTWDPEQPTHSISHPKALCPAANKHWFA